MKLGNTEYKLAYTMSALDEIEEKIGDVEALDTIMEGKGKFKKVIWLVTLGINSWISKEKALDPDFNVKKVTEEYVGALLPWMNPQPVIDEVLNAFNDDATPINGFGDEEDDNDPN